MRTIHLAFTFFIVTSCRTQTFTLTDRNPKVGYVYTSYNIFYLLGSDSLLSENCKSTLDSIVSFLNTNPNVKVEIGNHTDFRGDDNQNLVLSQKRAEKLRDYLILKGIQPSELIAKGYGETKPLRSKEDQNKLGDHAKNVNRRTTLKILK